MLAGIGSLHKRFKKNGWTDDIQGRDQYFLFLITNDRGHWSDPFLRLPLCVQMCSVKLELWKKGAASPSCSFHFRDHLPLQYLSCVWFDRKLLYSRFSGILKIVTLEPFNLLKNVYLAAQVCSPPPSETPSRFKSQSSFLCLCASSRADHKTCLNVIKGEYLVHLCEAAGSVCCVLSARFRGPKQPQSNICFQSGVSTDSALSRTITETFKCPVGAVQKNTQAIPPSTDRSRSAQVECQNLTAAVCSEEGPTSIECCI